MQKFLLDAQLPCQLKALFSEFGFESTHTLDLPKGNRTPDSEIVRLCQDEHWILVSKDSDFIESYLLHGLPEQMLLLSCGNLSNPDLEHLFRSNLPRIATEFESNHFIEVSREDLIVHS
jgi:predicted nuclease of predicted toxin-antitoxin system